MKRNLEAVCGNCPYWQPTATSLPQFIDPVLFPRTTGWCRHNSVSQKKLGDAWCGDHPDFKLSKKPTGTGHTSCPLCSKRLGAFTHYNGVRMCPACYRQLIRGGKELNA